MNNFFAGAEVITIYSLQDALDDGVIICLSSKEEHANDCKKFYKFPIYITSNLYNKHLNAAKAIFPNGTEAEAEKINDLMGYSIFDMLNASLSKKCSVALSERTVKFKYALQDTQYTFSDTLITNIATVGPGINGEPIVTFMMPEDQ